MANKHLSNRPMGVRIIDGDCEAWRYEEPGGISVVVRAVDPSGNFLCSNTVLIPWAALRASLRRKAKPTDPATSGAAADEK